MALTSLIEAEVAGGTVDILSLVVLFTLLIGCIAA